MTEAVEDKRWWQQPLQVTIVGVVVTAAIAAAVASIGNSINTNRWMEKTDLRITATELRMAELDRAQESGRVRGDGRQSQLNVHDTKIAVLAAGLDDLKQLVMQGNAKLDRLMEMRFGRADPPTRFGQVEREQLQ